MRMILEVEKVNIRSKVQWRSWLNQQFQNFSNIPLQILSGSIPNDLIGSFVKNTSAVFNRSGSQKCGHIYDGDGGIVKIDFKNGQAFANYKLIETESFKKENAENQFSETGWGFKQESMFGRMFNSSIKNTANASLLPLPHINTLIALGYYGKPYKLNYETLETVGEEDFGGILEKGETLGLDFKIDYEQGIMYNFGYTQAGNKTTLKLYKFDMDGNIIEQKSHYLDDPRILVQDFCMAEDYLVFFRSPQFFSSINLPNKKPLWDKINYKPELGTQILIYDKNTLELASENYMENSLVYNFLNGYQRQTIDQQIVIDYFKHPDFKKNKVSRQIPSEIIQDSGYNSKLHRILIHPQTGIYTKELKRCKYPSESGIIQDQTKKGQEHQNSFIHINDQRKEFDISNNIAKLDQQDDIQIYQYKDKNVVLGSPILANNGQYILSLGLNYQDNTNEMHIIDSESMEQICILGFDELLPFQTKGQWVQK